MAYIQFVAGSMVDAMFWKTLASNQCITNGFQYTKQLQIRM